MLATDCCITFIQWKARIQELLLCEPHPSQEVTFTEDDIEGLLSKLNIAKSAGPDGLHPRILKELSVQLAQPLFILFRMSLETGMLPEDWKIAQISPSFKKGHRWKPGNYRPVSLTAIICKILEKLVRRNIIDHLEHNELIDPAQHGFVKGRSCVTNHLETFEQWTQILDDRGCIDVIYMDFVKAFDKVPHLRLLVKLRPKLYSMAYAARLRTGSEHS